MSSVQPHETVYNLHNVLVTILTEINRNPPAQGVEKYLASMVSYLGGISDGYIFLKANNRSAASKALVRTALEAAFKIHAVRQKPAVLYQIGLYEYREDEKYVRNHPEIRAQISTRWQKTKSDLAGLFPGEVLSEHPFGARETAESAGVVSLYESYYRVFCHYTHATLRAAGGTMKTLEPLDDLVMSCALIMAVEAAVELEKLNRDIQELKTQFATLVKMNAELLKQA